MTKLHRLSSHRLIDADGHFYCASDISDCERLLKSALKGAGKVEPNVDPVWVNDPSMYTGPATFQYRNGRPIMAEEMEAYEADRDIRSERVTEDDAEASATNAATTPYRAVAPQAIMISRGSYNGTAQAKAGLKVRVPVKGDRQGRKCFITHQPGTIERVQLRRTPMPTLYVRLDKPAKFAGTHVTVYPDEAVAVETDDTKRGPGRPATGAATPVSLRVPDDIMEAIEGRDGPRTEIMLAALRAGLGLA